MLLVVLGGFIAMPYWTSFRIMEAARAGDAGRLSDHVNFPVLRENLSAQINALLVNATGEVGEESLLVALGVAAASTVSERKRANKAVLDFRRLLEWRIPSVIEVGT